MKRTIAIRLDGSDFQKQAFEELQNLFTAVCNRVAQIAACEKERNRVRLHHLCYRGLREEFPQLGSQMCCNAVAKTSAALSALKRPKELLFKKGCSVHFDKRTYSLKNGILSLYTLQGRVQIPLKISEFHQTFLNKGFPKEAELVRKGNCWFFHLVLDLPNVTPIESGVAIGVDLGENVLAATSTGKLFGGGILREKRDQFLAHRKRLSSNGSQSAKQRLRKISGKEKRYVRHVNHSVSKEIVSEAKKSGCSQIIMEDLKKIRERIKAGKKNAFSFAQMVV